MALKAFTTRTPNGENQVSFGDGIPTGGAYALGDIVIYDGSSTEKPYGWRCTAAGSPGTWESIGQSAILRVYINIPAGAAAADYDGVYPVPAGKLIRVVERHGTLGTDGSAVTVMLKKVPSGTALASGTDMLSAGISLKATINTNQAGAIHGTVGNITTVDGDSLGLVTTGVLTAVDSVSVRADLLLTF